MNIKSLEIDFEKEVLRINGKDFKENAVIVTLPGEDGWPTHKLFNIELASEIQEECNRLEISFIRGKSNDPLPNSTP